MKFLCVCNHGNCRSYAMARILKYSGHEAINVGLQFTSKESLETFIKWADYTIWLSEKPAPNMYTIFNPNIGHDRWGNPFNKDLNDRLINYLTGTVFPKLGLNDTINRNMVYNLYGKAFDWYQFGKVR